MLAITICVHCQREGDHCVCPAKPVVVPPLTWQRMSPRQKFLTTMGYLFAAIISIGCGVSTAAAFISLNLMTAGLACYLITGLFFLAGVAMNWYINKNAVPKVLVELFGKGRPFKDLMEQSKGVPLSRAKKIAMCFGVLFSLSVGFTNGVLAYAGTLTLTSAFGFLAAISSAFPPIAAILAGVTMICLTAVMLEAIICLIRTENLKGKCINFLERLFSLDEKFAHNKGKSMPRKIVERGFTVLLTLAALPLAALGLYMTMNASAAGAKIFLLRNIPNASLLGVEIASKGISLVLALIGRIPFTVRNIFKTIAKLCTKEEPPPAQVLQSQLSAPPSTSAQVLHTLKGVALYSLCVVNAVGNGLISVVGGGGVPSGVGGSINSLTAGASNIHLDPPAPAAPSAPEESKPAAQHNQSGLFSSSCRTLSSLEDEESAKVSVSAPGVA